VKQISNQTVLFFGDRTSGASQKQIFNRPHFVCQTRRNIDLAIIVEAPGNHRAVALSRLTAPTLMGDPFTFTTKGDTRLDKSMNGIHPSTNPLQNE
jgi:hypothetical protein